jgi:hypothetical protein
MPAEVGRVSGPHPALEWLSRRRDGESATLIAWRAGVTPETVRRATAPYGPFPRPSRHLGRTVTAGTALDERTRRWVQARQRGQRVRDIASRDGVKHQTVSRYTAEAGPFPSTEVVQEWVLARRAGRTVAAIALKYQAPEAVIFRETRPWGPFWRSGPRLPEGVVGVHGIAAMAGVSDPTAIRWVQTGRAPDPDFVVGDGHKLWLDSTISRWLDSSGLATCPDCGARCVSLNHHRSGAHRNQPPASAGALHETGSPARD